MITYSYPVFPRINTKRQISFTSPCHKKSCFGIAPGPKLAPGFKCLGSAWVKAAATFQWEATELRRSSYTVQLNLKAVVVAKMKQVYKL